MDHVVGIQDEIKLSKYLFNDLDTCRNDEVKNVIELAVDTISDYRDQLLWILEVDSYPKEVLYNCLWALDECQAAVLSVNTEPWEYTCTPYTNLVKLLNEFDRMRLTADRPICNRDGPILDGHNRPYMMFANATSIVRQVVFDMTWCCDAGQLF